jgi:hypothetical protein
MKFWEAIKALEEGKKIRRTYWPKSEYHYLWSETNRAICETTLPANIARLNLLNSWLSDEWELYQDPVQLCTFAEVIKGLREGKSYKRHGWETDCAIRCKHPHCFVTNEKEAENFTLEDFEANDWVEV